MFKAHELVVKLEKKPKYNRITDPKTDEEGLSPRPPMDRLDFEMLGDKIVEQVVTAYIAFKVINLICSSAEHVVVTKVK